MGSKTSVMSHIFDKQLTEGQSESYETENVISMNITDLHDMTKIWCLVYISQSKQIPWQEEIAHSLLFFIYVFL